MAELTPLPTDLEDGEESQISANRQTETDAVEPVEALSHATLAILSDASRIAVGRGSDVVSSDDLFVAMVGAECAVSRLLADLGMSADMLTDRMAFVLGRAQRQPVDGTPALSPRADRVLENAKREAGRREAQEVSSLHVLTALLREKTGVACLVLESPGLGLEPVGAALNRALREGITDPS